MSIDNRLIRDTRTALERLDLSEENNRITTLEAELGEIEAAIERANARRQEISQILHPDRAHPNNRTAPCAIADRLLAGDARGVVIDAAPSRDELEHERETLRLGIGELAQRRDAKRGEIDAVKREADRKAGAACEELAIAYRAEATKAAETIREAFAALQSIENVTRMTLADSAASAARTALDGASRDFGLLRRTKFADVPAAIVDALEPLGRKGKALSRTAPKQIQLLPY